MADAVTTTSRGRVRRVTVVGCGVAGLSATLELCERGIPVRLVSLGAPGESASALDTDGFNAALGISGDDPASHFEDTVTGGDFLADQPMVSSMTREAPRLLHALARMGVPFERTPEGDLSLRRSEASTAHRTATAGATTGHQIVRALDYEVRRWQHAPVVDARGVGLPGEKMVETLIFWELLSFVLDDRGVTVGIVVQDTHTSKIKAFPSDAVLAATGGFGASFAGSAYPTWATGSATAAAFRQGAAIANAEFVQLCPTGWATARGRRTFGGNARALGGRIWTTRNGSDDRRARDIPEKERRYFLERAFPGFGTLAPDDLVTRAVAEVIASGSRAFLDLRHLSPDDVEVALGSVLSAHRRIRGVDPRTTPIEIVPAVHHCLGGLWVDHEADAGNGLAVGSPRNHATTLPGLYAAGEAEHGYHGATCIGGNALLGAAYAGRAAARAMDAYRSSLSRSAFDLPSSVFDKVQAGTEEAFDALLSAAGDRNRDENPREIHRQLSELLLASCTIVRDDQGLRAAASELERLTERARRARLADASRTLNASARFLRHLDDMLLLAKVVVKSATERHESRGAFYRAGVARDDERPPRSSLAVHREDGPKLVREIDYACAGRPVHATDAVSTGLLAPHRRTYGRAAGTGRAPAES